MNKALFAVATLTASAAVLTACVSGSSEPDAVDKPVTTKSVVAYAAVEASGDVGLDRSDSGTTVTVRVGNDVVVRVAHGADTEWSFNPENPAILQYPASPPIDGGGRYMIGFHAAEPGTTRLVGILSSHDGQQLDTFTAEVIIRR
ncbi:hypothetical protein [Nocardia sp. NPDC051570]|uniref:hypothetical protein n=1 Tax=Nocardia sp. NPDC051570 TaxID=3364324 RepID=UPI00379304DD